jgi:hypothetical protein
MDLCLSLDRKRRRGTVPVPVPVFVAQPVVAAFAHTVNRSTAQVLGDKLLMYTLQMGSQDFMQNQTVPQCRRLPVLLLVFCRNFCGGVPVQQRL